MLRISLSPEDVKKSKIVEDPGFYPAEVAEVSTKPSKGDKSTNFFIKFRGLSGPVKDMTFNRVFNEKGMGFIVPLLKALGVEVNEDTGEVQDFDLEALIGRKLRIYVKQGEYNGQPTNEVAGYEPWDGPQG